MVDTNFLIYLLNGEPFIKPFLGGNFFISDITEMEMLGVKNISSGVLKVRSELIQNCYLINFNPEIKEIAIALKQRSNLKLPDAIIAASSLYMGFPLVTADKDIKKVDGLDVVLLKL